MITKDGRHIPTRDAFIDFRGEQRLVTWVSHDPGDRWLSGTDAEGFRELTPEEHDALGVTEDEDAAIALRIDEIRSEDTGE